MNVFGNETAASCVSASLNTLRVSFLFQQKRLRVEKAIQCVELTRSECVWGGNMCDIYLSSSMCVSLFGYLGINESTHKESAVTLPHLSR